MWRLNFVVLCAINELRLPEGAQYTNDINEWWKAWNNPEYSVSTLVQVTRLFTFRMYNPPTYPIPIRSDFRL